MNRRDDLKDDFMHTHGGLGILNSDRIHLGHVREWSAIVSIFMVVWLNSFSFLHVFDFVFEIPTVN